jgi:hypothetical protein
VRFTVLVAFSAEIAITSCAKLHRGFGDCVNLTARRPSPKSVFVQSGRLWHYIRYGKGRISLGCDAVENPVSLPDLHATILHLLGLDHRKLTYRFQGRDYRLTDVSGQAIKAILS